MTKPNIPKELLEKLQAVTSKRARVVIDHILEHGHITTEELKKQYGYNHPPRAARDVREQGIPLVTFKVKSSEGKNIGAYKFGDLVNIQSGRLGGRKTFSKKFKDTLYGQSNGKCAICVGQFEKRHLQIDHRIPYEIAGDIDHLNRDPNDYMLLCGSCNRAKSWSCENCSNWAVKSSKICQSCYWAFPQHYTHIAGREIRRIDILWDENEVADYDELRRIARKSETVLPEYVKNLTKKALDNKNEESEK